MTPNQFYQKYKDTNPKKLNRVITDSGTNLANFRQIASHKGAVSRKLAKKLNEASKGEMGILDILFQNERAEKKG